MCPYKIGKDHDSDSKVAYMEVCAWNAIFWTWNAYLWYKINTITESCIWQSMKIQTMHTLTVDEAKEFKKYIARYSRSLVLWFSSNIESTKEIKEHFLVLLEFYMCLFKYISWWSFI